MTRDRVIWVEVTEVGWFCAKVKGGKTVWAEVAGDRVLWAEVTGNRWFGLKWEGQGDLG